MTLELRLLADVLYRGTPITSPGLRSLLALLASDLRTGSSTARLVDELWPDKQPENPTKALQILVSRARSQLGSGLIATTPAGYRLTLREDQVDTSAVVLHASASAQHSRAGGHEAALEQAQAGLALWDGAPSEDDPSDDPLSHLRAERASTYRSLQRSRALALSRLGRYAEAVEPLTELAAQRPRDEELLFELLRCEAATAGPSAALARYESYRSTLRDELAADPGAPLQDLHLELLRGAEPPIRRGVTHEPNPLLGRDNDMEAVERLLRASRVTSIVGPGGIGKTRLAHAVLRRSEHRAAFFVGLAGVTVDGDMTREVASALGVGEPRSGPAGRAAVPADALAAIVDAVGAGPTLLVLDNCEHVLGGVAGLVQALISMAKDLRVLTTSRTPLGLSSESVYPLPELDLSTTVELFEQRARAARPGVETPADVVTELCRHLDGLPLAVELAAARVRAMSVTEIARRLDDRFALLRGGPRDAPQRHQTLYAVVGWSWNLLEPAGRAAMRAMSVFPGGFTAEAAEVMLDDSDAILVLEQLVDQSLLRVTDTAAGTRFRMLETVREFSAAQREVAEENDDVYARFATWAQEFAKAHHDAPFGDDPYAPMRRMRAEQDNLIQALRQALARSDAATVAAATAVLGALWGIESRIERLGAMVGETSWMLSHYRPEPELVEVTRTALTASTAYTFMTEGPRAVRSLVALRRLPAVPPDTAVRALATVLAAAADDLLEASDSDQPLLAAMAGSVVSYGWENEGELDKALAVAKRTLTALDDRDAPWIQAQLHARIAELYLRAEQGAEALSHLHAALSVLERLEIRSDIVGTRWWIVLANLQLGDLDEAEYWLNHTAPDPTYETLGTAEYGLGVRAEILLARGEIEAGLRLWRRTVDQLHCAVDQLRAAEDPMASIDRSMFLHPLLREIQAVAVVAHAHHGKLGLVKETVAELAEHLPDELGRAAGPPQPLLAQSPIYGAVLLALGMVQLDRGVASGDESATTSGVRMIALAERLGYVRNFQPTMSSARARDAAQCANRPAYEDAVSSYAGLDHDGLRAAAIATLRSRPSSTSDW